MGYALIPKIWRDITASLGSESISCVPSLLVFRRDGKCHVYCAVSVLDLLEFLWR